MRWDYDLTRRVSVWASVITFLLSSAIIAYSVTSSFVRSFDEGGPPRAIPPIDVPKELRIVAEQVETLRADFETLRTTVEAVSTTLNTASRHPESLETAQLAAQLQKVALDVNAISSALGSDLERGLSVPLLRSDLAQLEHLLDARTEAATKEIDRIYDQNKWFLGLMGTMAVGLLGLALSNFLQTRRTDG